MSVPNWQEFCTHGGAAMRKQPGDWCGWCWSYIPGAPPAVPAAATAAATMGDDTDPRTVDVESDTSAPQRPEVSDDSSEVVAEGGHSATTSEDTPTAPEAPSLFDEVQGSAPPPPPPPTQSAEPLELPPAVPVARRTDPGTSYAAAATARRSASENRDAVLLAHDTAGPAGLSGEQLGDVTGLPYQTIGPRRPALEDAGYIAKARTEGGKPLTRPNVRGNPEQVYVITAAGSAAAATLRSRQPKRSA